MPTRRKKPSAARKGGKAPKKPTRPEEQPRWLRDPEGTARELTELFSDMPCDLSEDTVH